MTILKASLYEIGEYVSLKSMPFICMKPFTISLVLYHSTLPSRSLSMLKIHLQSISHTLSGSSINSHTQFLSISHTQFLSIEPSSSFMPSNHCKQFSPFMACKMYQGHHPFHPYQSNTSHNLEEQQISLFQWISRDPSLNLLVVMVGQSLHWHQKSHGMALDEVVPLIYYFKKK